MSDADPGKAGSESLRIDKWLWQARFFKSRSLASKIVQGGKVRVNKTPTTKAHYAVRPGDVLTFQQGALTRVIQVVALGTRRGPAPEARQLYNDLAPPPERGPGAPDEADTPLTAPAPAQRDEGTGRPTKKERRQLDQAFIAPED